MENNHEHPPAPTVNYNLMAQGLVITIQLDQCTAISHIIGNGPLAEIRKLLRERDKNLENQQALIRHVNATKNN